MSKATFKLARRTISFGSCKTKRIVPFGERNAAPAPHDDKVPVADLPLTFRGTKRDLDMLLPQQDGTKASSVFYTEDGHLTMPYLVPLPVNRQPEGLEVIIYDQNTSRMAPLVFADAKISGISIKMKPKFDLEIKMTLHVMVDPDSQGGRLYQVMGNEREVEISATQLEMDLFLTPDEKKANAKQEDAFDEDMDDSIDMGDPDADEEEE